MRSWGKGGRDDYRFLMNVIKYDADNGEETS